MTEIVVEDINDALKKSFIEVFSTTSGKIVLKYMHDESSVHDTVGKIDKDYLAYRQGMVDFYLAIRSHIPKEYVFEAENLTIKEEK